MINGFASFTAFEDFFNANNVSVTLKKSNLCRVCYCEKTHRVTDEKYVLNVEHADGGIAVTVEYSGENGAFYALCDLKRRTENGTLEDGAYACSPSFAVRGYIEGFYGTPWTHDKRISVMKLMALNRMNTVYYAPKDDAYHRDLWRELYPETDLAKLKELVDLAKENYMEFHFCIAPGLSMKYSSQEEFDTLMKKTEQLYSIGIRSFGLLLDDIDEELFYDEDKAVYGETVNAHIDLVTKYYNALLNIESGIKLTVCPTLYHGKGDEYYISKLGKNISPQISLFWTGRDICSRELTSREAREFIDGTNHKPLYWDNYPVNDMAMFNEMHISPIINRDPDLWKYSEGIIANCMEYAESSKIPLITFADYLWDSENYNPEKSWENAVRQVVGEEDAEKFIVFADHLYTSCLKDEPSRRMKAHFAGVLELLKKGEKENAIALAREYIVRMNEAREYLKKDLPICNEVGKWSEKFFVACDMFEKLMEVLENKTEKNTKEFYDLIDKYDSMPVRLTEDMNIRLFLGIMFGI
ncbi:MAG: beta-N-acetylglucosaminidase domain-containing protein [Clostridia bacterium]|nr:beta-N-acetylglucosaminidase domain-containing protein [Clostridia bacterium]